MRKEVRKPFVFESISDLHQVLGLPKPMHPLVSFIDMSQIKCLIGDNFRSIAYNFYSVCIKKDFKGQLKYGKNYFDFDEGTMTFFSPGQVIATVVEEDMAINGWWLVFHPDFLRNSSLNKGIKNYGFFSYAINEALHLSAQEELMIAAIMKNVEVEYRHAIDHFSHAVMISHIELLLNYCNRFYNRQFITRKPANNDLLTKLEHILDTYFDSGKVQQLGLPTVQYLADELHISPNYLTDMLRSVTGQSTQQHIHHKLIDKAKEILTTTNLSVSEIAYQLGFEYPQSFSKLFKIKTDTSPLAYRSSFN